MMVTPLGSGDRRVAFRHDVLNDGTGCGGFTGEQLVLLPLKPRRPSQDLLDLEDNFLLASDSICPYVTFPNALFLRVVFLLTAVLLALAIQSLSVFTVVTSNVGHSLHGRGF